jgi:hypothetical protein
MHMRTRTEDEGGMEIEMGGKEEQVEEEMETGEEEKGWRWARRVRLRRRRGLLLL